MEGRPDTKGPFKHVLLSINLKATEHVCATFESTPCCFSITFFKENLAQT